MWSSATWALALGIALVLALGGRTARAQGVSSPAVIVISNQPEAPFVRRLAAELSLFGYRVSVVARSPDDPELGELLRRERGAALIAVDRGQQAAEIIVAGAGGALRRDRERLDPRRRADTNAAVLAERFRARLTELGFAPEGASQHASSERPPPDSPQAPPAASEQERRLWLALALGATGGGLGVMPDAQLEVRAFPARWLSTSAFGKWAPFAARVGAPEGSARVRLLAGGVLIDAYPLREPFSLKAGLGALLVSADMLGSAEPPFGGRDDSVLVAAGMAEVGAGFRLAPRLLLEARAFAGWCAPGVGVRFAGRSVAEFGQPFAGASLGAALGVF